MSLVLPRSTIALITAASNDHRHPGLQLDKFSIVEDQVAQKNALARVCEIPGDSTLLAELRGRWRSVWSSLPGATSLLCTTAGPLTLHLARASALENAGLCLHPLYGFAYLPGSGLKGMARAYAETVWLPAQADAKQAQAWRQIEDVFGWAPNPDRRRQIKDPEHPAAVRRANDQDPGSPETKSSAGNILFHDAWPESWPPLIVDIVNNHHHQYYEAGSGDNDHPPGDWEDPRPVYFLAVKPGTTFSFPLGKRRADVAHEPLALARQWLLGALCHLGAGAKTAAGYGAFKCVAESDAVPALSSQARVTFKVTLELASPAFLAGASQQADDCDLRPATLRGLLRWWWRTLHAGFVDVKSLRALEAAIWGDTRAGGAVRVLVNKNGTTSPHVYDKQSKAKFNAQQKQSELGIPNSDPQKTTQGLWYASFGMDERGRRRFVLEPPASWRLALVARSCGYSADRTNAGDANKSGNGSAITAEQVLEQAKAALWLLTHFGGVGSKSRKGLGSLAAPELNEWSTGKCRDLAIELRRHLQLPNGFNEGHARSPSLQQMLGPIEVKFPWPSNWAVIDQIGFAYQAFAKVYKHKRAKMALGLPRPIKNPQGEFKPLPPVTTSGRHSSPVHIHVDRRDGAWSVRAIAFPSAYLPDLATSRTFLEEFLQDFGNELQRRANLQPPHSGSVQGQSAPRRNVPPSSSTPILLRPGQRVESILLSEKTKKGGWKARHEPSGLAGPIQNTADVPGDSKPGDKLTMIVASASEREIAFRYPTPADEQRSRQAKSKPKRGPSGKRPDGGKQ